MNAKSISTGWHQFQCTIIKQGKDSPEIAVFACDAYDLSEIATVSRITDPTKGYQRIVNKRRKMQVSRFVEIPQAAIPTAIVLGIDTNKKYCVIEDRKPVTGSSNQWTANLKLRSVGGYKPCLIIDGQHRLEGIISSSKDSYPVAVTGLLDPSILVQMTNFFIINNKATRVSTAHTNELLASVADLTSANQQALDAQLAQLGIKEIKSEAFVAVLNDTENVFAGLLDFPSNKIKLVSSRELKLLIEYSRKRGFLQYIEDDDDEQVSCYNSLWLGVKNAFPDRWEFEMNLAKAAAEGTKTKEKLSDEKRLFHSGTISTLGSEIDTQLCSVPYRKKWMRNHGCIEEIVSSEILGNLPKTFWDKIQVDNTQKGRASLSAKLRKAMV